MNWHCAVYGCLSEYKDERRHFYSFPYQQARCRQWVRAAGRIGLEGKNSKQLNQNYRICDLHFIPSDQLDRKTLKINAIPSLNLPQPGNNGKLAKYTQTDLDTKRVIATSLMNSISTKTRDMNENDYGKMELASKRRQIRKLERRLKEYEIEETKVKPIVKKIVDIQKQCKRKHTSNRYVNEFKMFAMNIYLASPSVYGILAETLSLPTKRTLRRSIYFDIGTSLSENIIKCLQSKAKLLSESEKICVLCVGEMPLKEYLHYHIGKDKVTGFHEIHGIQKKEPATRAVVIIARGLLSKWKQPLVYCFLGQRENYSELKTWLETIIMQVTHIGFNVVAVTTDEQCDFISTANNENVTTTSPFFYVSNKKIYKIIDMPQLLVSLRNNFIKYDLIYHDANRKEETASWEDIQNLYDVEKERSYQMAFKLTESHVRPNNSENVKLAAQVFSRSVANAMLCLVELGKLPKKAIGTAKFIQLTNDTFDILNSFPSNETGMYKKCFSRQLYQMEVLRNMLKFLKDVFVVQNSDGEIVTGSVKCLKNLEITIQSVIQLSSDLRKRKFKSIFTRRLNQDVVKKFFAYIKIQRGHCRGLTPHQFDIAFKKLFLTHIFRQSGCANSPKGLDKLVLSVENSNTSINPDETITGT